MRKIEFTRDALRFIGGLQAKQFRQVLLKVLDLIRVPEPPDSQQLRGEKFSKYRRLDCGEFRIVYRSDEDAVTIALVGKRNDDEVYRDLGRRP